MNKVAGETVLRNNFFKTTQFFYRNFLIKLFYKKTTSLIKLSYGKLSLNSPNSAYVTFLYSVKWPYMQNVNITRVRTPTVSSLHIINTCKEWTPSYIFSTDPKFQTDLSQHYPARLAGCRSLPLHYTLLLEIESLNRSQCTQEHRYLDREMGEEWSLYSFVWCVIQAWKWPSIYRGQREWIQRIYSVWTLEISLLLH